MINKEKLIKFFKENNISESQDIPTFIRNFYTIFNVINDQEYFDAFIKGRNRYVRIPYKLKINKKFFQNLIRRINETKEIKKIKRDNQQVVYCDYNAVVAAAIIFYKMGYKFSNDEIARIKKCNFRRKIKNIIKDIIENFRGRKKYAIIKDIIENFRGRKKCSIIKNIIKNKECPREECEMYIEDFKKMMEILNNSEKTIEYIYNGFHNKNMEYNSILDDLEFLILSGKVNFNENVNQNLSKICEVRDIIEEQEIISSTQIIEQERKSYESKEAFEKKNEYDDIINNILETAIRKCKDKKALPYYLYQELNNSLVYNTITFSWSQLNPKIEKIIENDKTEDINAKSNKVTCHTWSRAMLDLLTKSGYEAYIINGNPHQFVLFFDEEHNAYTADGTNRSYGDRPHWFRGPDIIRSKLGIYPSNLYRVSKYDEYLTINDILYRDGILKSENDIKIEQFARREQISFSMENFKIKNSEYDYKAVFKFIDENPSMVSYFGNFIKERSKENEIIDVINEIIMNLIKGNEDDNLLLTRCVSNLVYVLKEQEKSIITELVKNKDVIPVYSINDSDDLYKKVDNGTKIVPLIYIKDKKRLNYFIWDDKKGFYKIEKKDLLDKINSGEYHSSKISGIVDKGTSKRYILPGLRSPRKTLKEEEEAIFGEEVYI